MKDKDIFSWLMVLLYFILLIYSVNRSNNYETEITLLKDFLAQMESNDTVRHIIFDTVEVAKPEIYVIDGLETLKLKLLPFEEKIIIDEK